MSGLLPPRLAARSSVDSDSSPPRVGGVSAVCSADITKENPARTGNDKKMHRNVSRATTGGFWIGQAYHAEQQQAVPARIAGVSFWSRADRSFLPTDWCQCQTPHNPCACDRPGLRTFWRDHEPVHDPVKREGHVRLLDFEGVRGGSPLPKAVVQALDHLACNASVVRNRDMQSRGRYGTVLQDCEQQQRRRQQQQDADAVSHTALASCWDTFVAS